MEIIYHFICIERRLAIHNKFKILTNHPLSEGVLLEYDEGFREIDWKAMDTLGTEDNHIKQTKMAECLTHLRIPANCFQSIAVRDERIQKIVLNKLNFYKITNNRPYVDIKMWF